MQSIAFGFLMMSTLDEVARLAGVSKSTVSRALADSSLISEKTRKRVQKVADELAYQPDFRAKSLRTRRTETVTVVIHSDRPERPNLTDPFMLKFIGVVGTELKKRDQDMLITMADCRMSDLGSQYVRSGKSDGLIIFGRPQDDSALIKMAENGIPLVCWGIPTVNVPYSSVGIDNTELTESAVNRLIESGRKRIGFIGAGDACAEFEYRYAGYCNALARSGRKVNSNLVIDTQLTRNSAYFGMQELMHHEPVDAIFACSDVMALEAISAIREAGLAIPDDIAIVGFDNIELGKCVTPALSSISQGVSNGGASALVEVMISLIEGGSQQTMCVPGEFVSRGSCGLAREPAD